MIASDAEFCPNPNRIWHPQVWRRGLPMAYKRTEVAIEKIIASCDGNMRGALEALMLVNEHLEEELQRLYTIMSLGGDEAEEYRFETVH
jgi:hypothetical protein